MVDMDRAKELYGITVRNEQMPANLNWGDVENCAYSNAHDTQLCKQRVREELTRRKEAEDARIAREKAAADAKAAKEAFDSLDTFDNQNAPACDPSIAQQKLSGTQEHHDDQVLG